MQFPFAVAQVRQNAGLLPRVRQLHAPLAQPQGLQLIIAQPDLTVDDAIADSVHHVAAFNTHMYSFASFCHLSV